MSDPAKNKKDNSTENKEGLKPDPETLHTTDPQEHMKGPISSAVQGVKHNVEDKESESKEDAQKRRNENL